MSAVEDDAVTKFREYLRIDTAHPTPDYEKCNEFLFKLADDLGIRRKVVYPTPGRPVVIMTIPGLEPDKKSVMLNSHVDVVPSSKEHWKHDPFSGEKEENGDIYGRGAQDMKCVGIQYLGALSRHFGRGKRQWRRTIHIVWQPDEELGGGEGMGKFCKMEEFKDMNVGFVLDEGIAVESDKFDVFYAERAMWWLKITCEGSPGHGSKFIENTAVEKMQSIVNSALCYRATQKKKKEDGNLEDGQVTSLNVTMINGGVQVNVVPQQFTVCMDLRVSPNDSVLDIETMFCQWCKRAGSGVAYEFIMKGSVSDVSPNSVHDAWWKIFGEALREQNCDFKKTIFLAGTDSRFIRELGICAIGFSPMNNMTPQIHGHNEYLNEKTFLRGIEIYETLIDRLAAAN